MKETGNIQHQRRNAQIIEPQDMEKIQEQNKQFNQNNKNNQIKLIGQKQSQKDFLKAQKDNIQNLTNLSKNDIEHLKPPSKYDYTQEKPLKKDPRPDSQDLENQMKKLEIKQKKKNQQDNQQENQKNEEEKLSDNKSEQEEQELEESDSEFESPLKKISKERLQKRREPIFGNDQSIQSNNIIRNMRRNGIMISDESEKKEYFKKQ